MHKIFEWMKAHPWETGILVLGGGFVFIVLSGWFSGGSSNAGTSASTNGPSPAQLAAQAQLSGEQIAGQVATHNTDVAASVKLNEDTLAAALGSKALDNQSQLQKQNYFAAINAQQLTVANDQAQRSLESEIANEQYQLAYHDQNVQDAKNAYDYQLQYHEQNVASDQNAYNYQLNYRSLVNQSVQEADNASITQQLISRIPTAQVG